MSGRTQSRGKAPTSPARVRRVDRQARALAMRVEGASSPQIAAALGVSRVTAWRLVSEALAIRKEEATERTEELRALEHERYEGYIAQLRPLALAGDLGAHRALLRWHERLAKLLNLDLRQEEIGGPQIMLVNVDPPAEYGFRAPRGRREVTEGEQVKPTGPLMLEGP